MGEKLRNKSKGKTPKNPKLGLRPHEQRQQQDAFKTAETVPQPVTDRRPPKA